MGSVSLMSPKPTPKWILSAGLAVMLILIAIGLGRWGKGIFDKGFKRVTDEVKNVTTSGLVD